MYIITQANDRPQQVGLRGFSAPPPQCDLKSIMDAESGRDAIRLALKLNPVRGYVKRSPAREQLEKAFLSVPPRFASDLLTELKKCKGPLGKCFCYRLATPTRETMLKILTKKVEKFVVEEKVRIEEETRQEKCSKLRALGACRTSRIIKSQKPDAGLLYIGIMTRVPQQAGESV